MQHHPQHRVSGARIGGDPNYHTLKFLFACQFAVCPRKMEARSGRSQFKSRNSLDRLKMAHNRRAMEVGVFTVLLGAMDLPLALDYLTGLGIQTVEIGAGGYAGTAHCPVDVLLESDKKAKSWLRQITSRGLRVSSLSCHGNPLHPNKKIAAEHDLAFKKAVRLAEKLGIDVVTTFSGCPGGAPGDKQPNWVTCPWPPDFLEILEYQWTKVAIPYWKKTVEFARQHGCASGFGQPIRFEWARLNSRCAKRLAP